MFKLTPFTVIVGAWEGNRNMVVLWTWRHILDKQRN